MTTQSDLAKPRLTTPIPTPPRDVKGVVMADVTSEETARRVEEARRFRHSTEMEGGRVPDAAQQDIAAYARGEVDEAEMLRRARQRYGLDGLPHGQPR